MANSKWNINPGVASGPAVVEATRPQWDLKHAPRYTRVLNRAEKGALKGKPFFLCYGGRFYPDDAQAADKSTWLQPGETMQMDTEVVAGIFGNLLTKPQHFDVQSCVAKFGGWEYEPLGPDGLKGIPTKAVGMKVIGPPEHLPDVVLQLIDNRGKTMGVPISIYDVCTKNVTFVKTPSNKSEAV